MKTTIINEKNNIIKLKKPQMVRAHISNFTGESSKVIVYDYIFTVFGKEFKLNTKLEDGEFHTVYNMGNNGYDNNLAFFNFDEIEFIKGKKIKLPLLKILLRLKFVKVKSVRLYDVESKTYLASSRGYEFYADIRPVIKTKIKIMFTTNYPTLDKAKGFTMV